MFFQQLSPSCSSLKKPQCLFNDVNSFISGLEMAHPANKWLVGFLGAVLIGGAALWEGDKREAYIDIVGVPTVCYGHTGPDVQFGKTYTLQECNNILRKDLIEHTGPMLQCINVPISENEYTAYALFTLNVGASAFCKSSLLKKLNAGDHRGACEGLMQWVYAGGKQVKGLYNRRLYERAICLGTALPKSY